MQNNKVHYSREMYSLSAVSRAILDFNTIAQITLREEADTHVCTFLSCLHGEERTQKEFENYIIDLLNYKESPV